MTRACPIALLLALAFLLAPITARAATQVISCQDGNQSDWPASPLHPCPTVASPPATTGNASLATSTTSALISGATANSRGAALPTTLYELEVANPGATAVAFCPNFTGAATCTCSSSSVAATNGFTIAAGAAREFTFPGGLPSANPEVVACSGTPTIELHY